MNSLLLFVSMLAVQPQLPTATVVGDVVTVPADIAWVDPAVGSTIVVPLATVQGTVLVGSTMLASYDGVAPAAWRLPPGSYKITAFGYPPDRLNPMRSEIVLDVIIANPTRAKQIKDALQRFTLAKAEYAQAKAALDALNPTRAELRIAALP